MTGRRLLFFFDGTTNSAGSHVATLPTNVFRLIRSFTYGFAGVPQITFYFSGVGTRGDRISAVTGRGFDQIVAEGYVNLASNYMDGDAIYIFGFSRGAAAARALAGLLSDPGLLPADNLESLPELWSYFLHGSTSREGFREMLLSRFHGKLFEPKPKVSFLGLFDAVPGTGWDRLNLFSKVRFENHRLDDSVDAAVHILAMDDDRVPSFSPLLWNEKGRSGQVMEQIWLPGVHADIGGCSDGRFIGNVALLTMLDRISKHCPELELDTAYVASVRNALKSARDIAISSEREGLLRKLLRSGRRPIGHTHTEHIGILANLIRGEDISVRGVRTRYAPNLPTNLSVFTTDEDVHIEQAVRGILNPPDHR